MDVKYVSLHYIHFIYICFQVKSVSAVVTWLRASGIKHFCTSHIMSLTSRSQDGVSSAPAQLTLQKDSHLVLTEANNDNCCFSVIGTGAT